MKMSEAAKQLGRQGGLKRALKLSKIQKREIALSGNRARLESFMLAKRIEENFYYVEVVREVTGV